MNNEEQVLTTRQQLVNIFNKAPNEVQQMANRWYIDDDNVTLQLANVLAQDHISLYEIKNIAHTLQTAFNLYFAKSTSLCNELYEIVEGEAA